MNTTTKTFTMEDYRNAVNKRNLTEIEKSILLNDNYAALYVKNINDGIQELSSKTEEEIRNAFEESRNVIEETFQEPVDDYIKDIVFNEFNEIGISLPKDFDFMHFSKEGFEVLVSAISKALNIQ